MAKSGDLDLTYSNIKVEDLMRHNEDHHMPEPASGAKVVWGWNDPDNEEFKQYVTYLHKKTESDETSRR